MGISDDDLDTVIARAEGALAALDVAGKRIRELEAQLVARTQERDQAGREFQALWVEAGNLKGELAARDEAIRLAVDKFDRLLVQLEIVRTDPKWNAVWISYHVHGGRYQGATYSTEVSEATVALARLREVQGRDPRVTPSKGDILMLDGRVKIEIQRTDALIRYSASSGFRETTGVSCECTVERWPEYAHRLTVLHRAEEGENV